MRRIIPLPSPSVPRVLGNALPTTPSPLATTRRVRPRPRPRDADTSCSRRFSSSPLSSPSPYSSYPSSSSHATIRDEDGRDDDLDPIDFDVSSCIIGDESQVLEVILRPNQSFVAESGAMLYMTEGVVMETSMLAGGGGGGGGKLLSTAVARLATGQNLMISNFRYVAPPGGRSGGNDDDDRLRGTVGLGTDFPAKILKFDLSDYPDGTLVCQKGAFLAGSSRIALEMAYAKSLASGFFGGEGFVLQRLRGTSSPPGGGHRDVCFVKAYGTVVKRDIRPGEVLRVSSGSLVCMTVDVTYDVTTVSGFKNVLFGGEGLFVTTLTGPGTVWLQGTSIAAMASEIARRLPAGGGIGFGIPIMGGGGGVGDGGGGDAEGGVAESAGAGDPIGMSDAAVEADRNAAIATSGMSSSSSSSSPSSAHDPESSESLFGDAVYGGEGGIDATSLSALPEDTGDGMIFSDGDRPPGASDAYAPDFEGASPDEDDTTFSTYEDGGGDVSKGAGAEMPSHDDAEGPNGLFGQLWDLFRDLTDDKD